MATDPDDDTMGTLPPGVLRALVSSVETALNDFASASWVGASPAEIGLALTALTRLAARLTGAQLQLAAEADRVSVGSEAGASSAAAWWAHETKTTHRLARSAVKLARDTEAGGRCPVVGAALADGLVLEDQARVIVKAVAELPSDLDPALRELAEKTLVDLAADHDADALRVLGRGILAVVAPDVAEDHERTKLEDQDRRAWEEIRFSMTDDGDGMTRGRFTIPTPQAHVLRKLLLGFLAKQRRDEQRSNRSDHPDQPCDGTSSDIGEGGASVEDVEDAGDSTVDAAATGQDGDQPADEPAEDITDEPVEDTAAERDTARAAARAGASAMGEAFVAMLEGYPVDAMPHHGGVNPTLVATMTLDQLTGSGPGADQPVLLDSGIKTSAGQARRWACNAGIVPVVLGTGSVVLDMGRRARIYNSRQRLAMAIRDGGCTAVGCDRPPSMCQAHHMAEWVRGRGPSDLAMGRLLCWFHHRLIHDSGYDHEIRADGKIAFVLRT